MCSSDLIRRYNTARRPKLERALHGHLDRACFLLFLRGAVGVGQRVAIARALIQEPELLLLDEPFGALDSLTRDTLTLELMRIWEEARPSVVMVTHSVFEAALSADRILIFSPPPGRITADVRIDLPRPRSSELRYDREFLDLTRRLRALIGAAG